MGIRPPYGFNHSYSQVEQTLASKANWDWLGLQLDAVYAATIIVSRLSPGAKGSLIVSDGTTRQDLTVGSNGQILVPDSAVATGLKWYSKPTTSMYLNTAQSLGISGSLQKVNIDTAQWDIFDGVSSAADTAGKRIVIRTAGKYLITAGTEIASGTSLYFAAIFVNGVQTKTSRAGDAGGGNKDAAVSGLFQLAVNDVIELYAFSNAATQALSTGPDNCYLQVQWLQP